MLEARGISTYPDKLHSDVEGDIENIDGKPVITRIRVRYHLNVPAEQREKALRALDIHERHCPAAESVKRGIAIEWTYAFA